MSRLLTPASIVDPRELVELVSGAISEIVSGGFLIDFALGNEEYGYFDLVAANENREGVLFFLNSSGDEVEYLRFLKCMCWYQENWRTVQKLHAGRVALGPIPTVFVVAPRYSNSMRKVLLNVGGSRITLLKYNCFQDSNGKKSLSIEKVEDSSAVGGKTGFMYVSTTCPSRPAADWPNMPMAEKIKYLREFCREMEADISNVSDEELLDLLG
jgi:hypothetical protein